MNLNDKRRSRREDYALPLALILATGSLKGRTLNLSREGALIEAEGQISMTFVLNGREYKGQLVRASANSSGTMTCAVEFETPLSGIESTESS